MGDRPKKSNKSKPEMIDEPDGQQLEFCLVPGCPNKAKFPYRFCEAHLHASGKVQRIYTPYYMHRLKQGWKT
jgi:hypothetical protein